MSENGRNASTAFRSYRVTRHDRGAKRERYLRRAAEYWIVDLDSRLIERWRPGDDRPVIAQDKIAWQPVPSVPPLLIDVEAVFAELPDEESPHRPNRVRSKE